jgi:hypothetical protein
MKRKSGGVVMAYRIDVLLDDLYHLFAHDVSGCAANHSRREPPGLDEPELAALDLHRGSHVTWAKTKVCG